MGKIDLTSCLLSPENRVGHIWGDYPHRGMEFVNKDDDLTIAEIYRNHLAFIKACVRKLGIQYAYPLADEDVEDIAQDTILKLHDGALANYRGEVSLRGYLKITARTVFLDFIRRRSNRDNRRAVELDPSWMFLRNPVEDILGNPEKTVDEMILHDVFNLIRQHLLEIPETSRLIFTMIYDDAVPQVEIAERLGLSSAAVSTRYREALQYLRQKLEKCYPKKLIFN